MSSTRTPYPSDVSDDEWTFVVPYLTLLAEDAGQRKHALREVFNGLRYLVKTGMYWRMLPHDLPPWPVVSQQMRRWMAAEWFEAMVHDLRVLLRRATTSSWRHHWLACIFSPSPVSCCISSLC